MISSCIHFPANDIIYSSLCWKRYWTKVLFYDIEIKVFIMSFLWSKALNKNITSHWAKIWPDQRLRALTTLADELSLFPSTHFKCLTTTYNSSSRRIQGLAVFILIFICNDCHFNWSEMILCVVMISTSPTLILKSAPCLRNKYFFLKQLVWFCGLQQEP